MPNEDPLGDFADRMYRAHGLDSPAPLRARQARLKVWTWQQRVVFMGFPGSSWGKIGDLVGCHGVWSNIQLWRVTTCKEYLTEWMEHMSNGRAYDDIGDPG